MVRVIGAGLVLVMLAGCGASGRVSGDIGRACIRADREAASPRLCGCVQQAADQTLSAADQRRAARFFADPQAAQDIRASDRPADDAFWDRYRAFADRARSLCG